jgi:HAMP domain-containing protein
MKFRRASKAPAAAQAATESPAAEAQRGHGLTIRLKLTLWYGTLFLVAGVLLIAVNYFMVRGSLTVAPEKARATVAEELGIPSEQLERSFSPQFAPQESEDWFLPGGTGGGHGAGDREPLQVLVQTEDGEYVAVDVPQLIQLTQQELKQEALRQLWIWSLVALAIMTVITFGSAWFLAGRMLRPLHAITSTARRLSGSTLHERIALKGPRDELKELADTFDEGFCGQRFPRTSHPAHDNPH